MGLRGVKGSFPACFAVPFNSVDSRYRNGGDVAGARLLDLELGGDATRGLGVFGVGYGTNGSVGSVGSDRVVKKVGWPDIGTEIDELDRKRMEEEFVVVVRGEVIDDEDVGEVAVGEQF